MYISPETSSKEVRTQPKVFDQVVTGATQATLSLCRWVGTLCATYNEAIACRMRISRETRILHKTCYPHGQAELPKEFKEAVQVLTQIRE